MHIDSIELFHVAMPLIYPWRTAYGEDAAIESVLVRMKSGDLVAWGESSPLAAPCYSPEWAGGVFACLAKWLAPAMVGQEIDSGQALAAAAGTLQRQPLRQGGARYGLVGAGGHAARASRCTGVLGATRDGVDVGADFGVMDRVEELLPQIAQAVRSGLPAHQAEVPPRLGHADAAGGAAASFPTRRSTSTATAATG